MQWIKTSEQVPQSDVLVLCDYYGLAYKLLIWNTEFQCWDHPTTYDYYCDKDIVDYWMRLPELP